MDRTPRRDSTAIQTAGGLADRDTVIWPDSVLWDDDDCILGCSAAAPIIPRALGYHGDLTDDAVTLTGRTGSAYPLPALEGLLVAR